MSRRGCRRCGGCCGLAGNFGVEQGHYDVSVAVAEHDLLPAVRRRPDAVVLADGFSCRTQLAELADRHALTLAELLAPALRKVKLELVWLLPPLPLPPRLQVLVLELVQRPLLVEQTPSTSSEATPNSTSCANSCSRTHNSYNPSSSNSVPPHPNFSNLLTKIRQISCGYCVSQ